MHHCTCGAPIRMWWNNIKTCENYTPQILLSEYFTYWNEFLYVGFFQISLFQSILSIDQKTTKNNNEPLKEKKPTGDQIAVENNNEDASQIHMGQNNQDTLTPDMKRTSKYCTVL